MSFVLPKINIVKSIRDRRKKYENLSKIIEQAIVTIDEHSKSRDHWRDKIPAESLSLMDNALSDASAAMVKSNKLDLLAEIASHRWFLNKTSRAIIDGFTKNVEELDRIINSRLTPIFIEIIQNTYRGKQLLGAGGALLDGMTSHYNDVPLADSSRFTAAAKAFAAVYKKLKKQNPAEIDWVVEYIPLKNVFDQLSVAVRRIEKYANNAELGKANGMSLLNKTEKKVENALSIKKVVLNREELLKCQKQLVVYRENYKRLGVSSDAWLSWGFFYAFLRKTGQVCDSAFAEVNNGGH